MAELREECKHDFVYDEDFGGMICICCGERCELDQQEPVLTCGDIPCE